MKPELMLYVCTILMFVIAASYIHSLNIKFDALNSTFADVFESNEQFLLAEKRMVLLNRTAPPPTGIYYYDYGGYYCVWTADRTSEEIATTEVHETCHALVYKEE